MADFSVPNYSDLIDNLNPQIAAGPPKVDFSGLERIPQSYYQGQKNQYDQRLRNIFSGGVPQNADGSVDYASMAKSLLQTGGAPEVQNAINLGNVQLGRDVLGSTGVLPPSTSNVQPTGGGAPVGVRQNNPGNIENGSFTQSQPGYQQGNSRFASFSTPDAGFAAADKLIENYGQKGVATPLSIASRWAPAGDGQNNPQQYGAYIAQQLGVSPDTRLDLSNPAVRQKVVQAVTRFEGNGSLISAAQQQPQSVSEQQNPQTQAPFAQQSPTPTQNVPNQPTETLANAYEARASYFYQQAKGLAFINPKGAEAAQKQGDQAAQQALAIRKSLLDSSQPTNEMKNANASGIPSPFDYERAKIQEEASGKNAQLTPEQKNAINSGFRSPYEFDAAKLAAATGQKNLELTGEQKNAGASGGMNPLGFEAAKEANKQDNDTFQKRYTGLQSLGEQSHNGIQKAQLMKNLTLDPNFYSGPLNKEVQTYHQFKAIFGSNPSSALPTEAFNKVANDMLTEQVKAMGQSGVGRVLQTEVNMMKQAIASLGITPQSNRALAEIVSRVYQQNQDIADIARNLKAPPGQKNVALDTAMNAYMKTHPLFTPQDIQHPATLGAPDAPPQSAQWSPQQKRQWAQSIGLKQGDPIRFGGQVVSVP